MSSTHGKFIQIPSTTAHDETLGVKLHGVQFREVLNCPCEFLTFSLHLYRLQIPAN